MSAASRLWRRAPLWRLALASAATFAALSALYPTPALRALIDRASTGGAAMSEPPAPPLIGTFPPFDRTFRETIPFAGRVLPLPRGDWHELVSGREERGTEIDFTVLGRVEHGTLTGAVLAVGTVLPVTGPLEPHLPFGCFDSRSAVAVPPSDTGPHDCWFVRKTTLAELAPRAVGRLGRLSVTVPPALLATTWSRAEGGSLETVTIARPPSARVTVGEEAGVMRRWRALLRRGFDGTLTGAEMARANG